MRQNPFVSILHFYEMCLNQNKRRQDFHGNNNNQKTSFHTVKWKHTCRYIGIKWKTHPSKGALIFKTFLFDLSDLLAAQSTGSWERSYTVGQSSGDSQRCSRENGIVFLWIHLPSRQCCLCKTRFCRQPPVLAGLGGSRQDPECKGTWRMSHILTHEQVSANPEVTEMFLCSVNSQ